MASRCRCALKMPSKQPTLSLHGRGHKWAERQVAYWRTQGPLERSTRENTSNTLQPWLSLPPCPGGDDTELVQKLRANPFIGTNHLLFRVPSQLSPSQLRAIRNALKRTDNNDDRQEFDTLYLDLFFFVVSPAGQPAVRWQVARLLATVGPRPLNLAHFIQTQAPGSTFYQWQQTLDILMFLDPYRSEDGHSWYWALRLWRGRSAEDLPTPYARLWHWVLKVHAAKDSEYLVRLAHDYYRAAQIPRQRTSTSASASSAGPAGPRRNSMDMDT